MPWTADDEEINGVIDSNMKSSPPNPPAINTAETVRNLFKAYWSVVRGQVQSAVEYVDLTNSSVYIQESIAQVQNLKNQVEVSELAAQNYKSQSNNILQEVVSIKNDVEDFASTANQTKKFQGLWNPSTNIPDLSGLGYDIAKVGFSWECSTNGTNSITGSSVNWEKGDYAVWNGTDWYRSTQSTAERLRLAELEKTLEDMPDGSYYIYSIQDNEDRFAFGIRILDGVIEGRFEISESDLVDHSISTDKLQNGSVTIDKLSENVKEYFFEDFDNSQSDYVYLVIDSENKIGFGIKKSGEVVGRTAISDNSISEAKLTSEVKGKLLSDGFKRINNTNFHDVTIDIDDDFLRGQEFEIPAKTYNPLGFAYCQFPPCKTKVLKGKNDTGATLQFKNLNGIKIAGMNYRGGFDPSISVDVGVIYKGNYGNSYSDTYPAFPSGNTGDFWVIDCGNSSNTKTANGLTFKNGDLLVKTASSYAIQPAPGNGTYNTNFGEFWNITAPGTFGGLEYKTGDRIYILGLQSQSGPKYIKWAKGKKGTFWQMGECDGNFAPTSMNEGDLYVFSANATTQGITGIVGDFLMYTNGGWCHGDGKVINVPNGNSFVFPCRNANEWAVRRLDKSSTQVSVKAWGQRSTIRRKSNDSILLLSDSMFGVSSVGNNILAISGRTGIVKSFGGGTSNDVFSMYCDFILSGDAYAGHFPVFWHGQNNQTDVIQIKNIAHRLAAAVGIGEKRFCFWSVLGQRSVTFNGSRLVAGTQEGAITGNNITEIEQFYEATYPNQYFSPRKALLEAAKLRTNIKDIHFPGMTEAQSAETYGVLPFSYFFKYSDKPFSANNLNFLGYYSAVELPSGGLDNDYYLRTGNGSLGNPIVKVAGTWIEYTWDTTHLSPEGSTDVANKFNEYLTIKGM